MNAVETSKQQINIYKKRIKHNNNIINAMYDTINSYLLPYKYFKKMNILPLNIVEGEIDKYFDIKDLLLENYKCIHYHQIRDDDDDNVDINNFEYNLLCEYTLPRLIDDAFHSIYINSYMNDDDETLINFSKIYNIPKKFLDTHKVNSELVKNFKYYNDKKIIDANKIKTLKNSLDNKIKAYIDTKRCYNNIYDNKIELIKLYLKDRVSIENLPKNIKKLTTYFIGYDDIRSDDYFYDVKVCKKVVKYKDDSYDEKFYYMKIEDFKNMLDNYLYKLEYY